MRTYLFIRRAVLVASLMLIPWLSPLSTYAADRQSGGATPASSAGALDIAAVGAAEDTLKACLARIPKDATAGQRMIATQSCEQEDEARKLIQAVPAR